jgi:hypothetical protein
VAALDSAVVFGPTAVSLCGRPDGAGPDRQQPEESDRRRENGEGAAGVAVRPPCAEVNGEVRVGGREKPMMR